MRQGGVFLTVALAMIIAIGITAAAVQPTPPAKTTIGLGSGSSGYASSVQGLQLSATLNGSEFISGQTVSLAITELNTLDSQNGVPASGDWKVQGLGLGPCGRLDFPFGFVVVQGFYTSGPLNSSQELQLYQPGRYLCPAFGAGVSAYSFYPASDHANISGFCSPEPCLSLAMNQTSEFSGNWVGNAFTEFSPGIYTVVVGDEWGALVTIHFTVASSSAGEAVLMPEGASFTVTSSYDCVAGHYSLQFNTSGPSTLGGAFSAGPFGVTLYVASSQQAASITDGHPSTWVYSTGQAEDASFSVQLGSGSYVVWIEGQDMNCGARIVEPLEVLTQVNVTQSFAYSG